MCAGGGGVGEDRVATGDLATVGDLDNAGGGNDKRGGEALGGGRREAKRATSMSEKGGVAAATQRWASMP